MEYTVSVSMAMMLLLCTVQCMLPARWPSMIAGLFWLRWGCQSLLIKSLFKIAELNTASNEQALTYRVGHHSTSDDSTKYRSIDEIEHWKTARDPVSRFRKWVEGNGWWSEAAEVEHRSSTRKEVL